jgi:hypothetical protein
LFEIKGLTINTISQGIEGYLTAEEVYKRIKEHYEGVKKKKGGSYEKGN